MCGQYGITLIDDVMSFGGCGGRVGRALDWRPGGPGLESRCGNLFLLRNFGNSVYPALPVSFGGDTKAVGPFYLVLCQGK